MLSDNMHALPNPKQFLTLWINFKSNLHNHDIKMEWDRQFDIIPAE